MLPCPPGHDNPGISPSQPIGTRQSGEWQEIKTGLGRELVPAAPWGKNQIWDRQMKTAMFSNTRQYIYSIRVESYSADTTKCLCLLVTLTNSSLILLIQDHPQVRHSKSKFVFVQFIFCLCITWFKGSFTLAANGKDWLKNLFHFADILDR